FGLLSARTTLFSKRDGVCSAGVVSPNARLHGSSLSGSAAAPVAPLTPTAPASAMPCPSRARRLIRPLPATAAGEDVRPRRADLLMLSSLMDGVLHAPSHRGCVMLRSGMAVVQTTRNRAKRGIR